MRVLLSLYLIVISIIWYLWISGPLYYVGIIVAGHDLMSWVIQATIFITFAIGVALPWKKSPPDPLGYW